MIEGPPCADAAHQGEQGIQLKNLPRGPRRYAGTVDHDIARGLRPHHERDGAARWLVGTAMLCYVTRQEHLGLPIKKDVKDESWRQDAAHARPRQGNTRRADPRQRGLKARFEFRWEGPFNLGRDGGHGEGFTTRTFAEGLEKGRTSARCAARFLLDEDTQDSARYVEKGCRRIGGVRPE